MSASHRPKLPPLGGMIRMVVDKAPYHHLPLASYAGTHGSDCRLAGPHAGRRSRPPGSGLSSIPASGFGVWRGRCFAVTRKSAAGKRPTTCSWKRSPGSTGPWRPSSPSPRGTSTTWRRPRSAVSSSTCLAATTEPRELGSHHDTAARNPEDDTPPKYEQADSSGEPASLMEWTEFHEQVEVLPEEEQEVFNLVWYEQTDPRAGSRGAGRDDQDRPPTMAGRTLPALQGTHGRTVADRMTMTANDDQFRDLLDRWEELREQGQEPSVEELCRDAPHLAERLREWTRVLKMSRLDVPQGGRSRRRDLWRSGCHHDRGTGEAPGHRRVRRCWRSLAAAGWGGSSRQSTAR